MIIRIPKGHAFYKLGIDEAEANIIVCNKCGLQLPPYNQEEAWEQNMAHSMDTEFGYGSRQDMEHWKWHVCENCLIEWISSFKIAPDGFERPSFSNWKQEEAEKKKTYNRYFNESAYEHLVQSPYDLHSYEVNDEGLQVTFKRNWKEQDLYLTSNIEISSWEKNTLIYVRYRAQLLRGDIMEPYYVWSEDEMQHYRIEILPFFLGLKEITDELINNYSSSDPKIRLLGLYDPIEIHMDKLSKKILNIKK